MNRSLLMTVATMGVFGTTYGAGDLLTEVAAAPTHHDISEYSTIGNYFYSPAESDDEFSPEQNINTFLAEMPAADRETLVTFVAPFIEGLSSEYQFLVMYSLAKLEPAERADVIDKAHGLFWSEMKQDNRAQVIETLSCIPVLEREGFIALVLPFLTDFELNHRAKIIQMLGKMPESDRVTFIRSVHPIVSHIDKNDRLEIIDNLSCIVPRSDLASFIQMVQALIDIKEKDCCFVMHSLLCVPSEERASFAAQVVELLDPRMDAWWRSNVISLMNSVPIDRRATFIEILRPLIAGTFGRHRFEIIYNLFYVPCKERGDVAALIDAEMDGFMRAGVIFAFSAVPAADRVTFVHSVLPLIECAKTYSEQKSIIKALAEVPMEKRADIGSNTIKLFQGAISKKEDSGYAEVIRALAYVPVGELDDFIATIMPLFEGKKGEIRIKVIRSVVRKPLTERVAFIHSLLPLIKGIEDPERFWVFKSLAQVAVDDRIDVSAQAVKLFGSGMHGGCRAYVIRILSGMTSVERSTFADNLLPLIAGVEGEARLWMIHTFAKVPLVKRSSLAAQLNDLIHAEMSASGRGQLIRILDRVPVADLVTFKEFITSLIHGISGEERISLIQELRCILPTDRLNFTAIVSPLIDRLNVAQRVKIILTFTRVPAPDRAALAAQADDLFGIGMNGDWRAALISVLARVPAADRVNVIEFVTPYIEDIRGSVRVELIRILSAVPADGRATFAAQANELFGVDMHARGAAEILRILAVVLPAPERADFIRIVLPLLSGLVGGNRIMVIRALVQVPAANRGKVATRVTKVLEDRMDGDARVSLIELMAR